MSNTSLKIKAAYDFPEFVRDDYVTFISFMESYHTWLESNQSNLMDVCDIDKSLDSFVQYFKKEVNYQNLSFPYVNEKFLLRRIKELYLAKGTEESYVALFKMMFNKEVILKYPERMLLKPSDGKWEQLTSIFVEVANGNAESMVNKIVNVTNLASGRILNVSVENVQLRRFGGGVSTISLSSGGTGYTSPTITFAGGGGSGAAGHAVVQSGIITSILIDNPGTGYDSAPTVIITGACTTQASVSAVRMYLMPNIYECNIDKGYYGSIEIGDRITFGEFSGKILPTINSYTILDGGSNFRLGQTFKIDTTFGKGALVKVTKISSSTKALEELKFIEFGYGYLTDFESVDMIPPNTSQTSLEPVFTGLNGTLVEYIKIDPSGGYVLNENFSKTTSQELYAADYAGEIKREFYASNQYGGDPNNGARVSFKLGSVCKYIGHYVNSDGMLSDENTRIQDSLLYQKYSYIVQVDEKLQVYQDILKSLLHPAGTAMFGEYDIRTKLDVSIKLESIMSLFAVAISDAVTTSYTIEFNKTQIIDDVTNDSIYTTQRDWAQIWDTCSIISGWDITDPGADFVTVDDINIPLITDTIKAITGDVTTVSDSGTLVKNQWMVNAADYVVGTYVVETSGSF